MGKRIVDELGLTNSCETLAKWMAHYLAEQMKLAEAETDPLLKQKAEQRCMQLILQLWKKRFIMPGKVAPLANLKDALNALQEMNDERNRFAHISQHTEENDNPWFEFACKSYSIDRKMSAIAYLVGILENDIGVTRQWMDEHKSVLSKEERKLIENLDNWINDEMAWDINGNTISIGALQPKDRTTAVLRRLEEVLQQQVEALQHLKTRLSFVESRETQSPAPT